MKNRRMRNVECGMRNRHLRASYSISKSEIRNLKSDRRGILLLVVLSMLTLFLLIGTAFIVTSDQYRKTQKTMARLTETSNSSIDQQDLLNEVLNQLLRDTNNSSSSLRFHSLLQDMYGNDGIYGRIDTSARSGGFVTQWAGGNGLNTADGGVTGGQMIEFTLLQNVPTLLTDQYGLPVTLSLFDQAYNGRLLTFLDGPARGQSVRIVGYLGDTNWLFRVMTPRLADGSTLSDPSLLDGSKIAINGRPFNGTGFGYDRTPSGAPKLTALEALSRTTDANTINEHFLTSLMPNSAMFDPANLMVQDYLGPGTYNGTRQDVWSNLTEDQRLLLTRLHFGGIGGSDESYDAVDFQNMLLALVPTRAGERAQPNDGALVDRGPDGLFGTEDDRQLVIPSLHRPALINYWRNRIIDNNNAVYGFEPKLLRKVSLRTNWLDHPNFTGSNPEVANLLALYQGNRSDAQLRTDLLNSMIYGPWDVDNDLDGIRDSVWVDAGQPVMENHDGRLVKPLVALMVVDMDGRLNLNAHGSEDIANAFNTSFDLNLTSIPKSNPNELDDFYSSDLLPHGIGFGPAEISLDPLMPYDDTGSLNLRQQRWKWYRRFFRGVPRRATLVADRNQFDELPEANVAARLKFERDTFGKFGVGLDQNRNVINNPAPGLEGQDLAMELKNPGMPKWSNGNLEFFNRQTQNTEFVLGGYASQPDPRGRYGVGINDYGQVVYESFEDRRNIGAAMDRDTPYELDLSLGANRGDSLVAPDGAYTIAELERILRPYDADAGVLPSRIWEMAGEFKNNVNDTTPNLDVLNLWRTTVTTDSYDLPSPSVVVPQWMVFGPDGLPNTRDEYEALMGKPPVNATFSDLLEYRFYLAFTGGDSNRLNDRIRRNVREIHLPKLLPPDLANGLRLDINRPIGNGRDDNDNGVVDEPGEWDGTNQGQFGNNQRTEAPYWESERDELNAFTGNNGQFRDERILYEDRDNDGTGGDVDVDDLNLIGVQGTVDTAAELVTIHNLRRQMLARDLYILAQTLAEPIPPQTAAESDIQFQQRFRKQSRAQARKLAQWAINVVDFRDPDNIMTAFEYDINPFDGWGAVGVGIDGNPGTLRDVYGADAKIDNFNSNTAVTPANEDIGGIVWGAERPELLITETLGWHDRATENTNKEDPANDEDGDGDINDDDTGTVPLFADANTDLPDTDYDQRLRPRGAAFVELYCPWPDGSNQGGNNNNFVPAYNRDVYAVDANGQIGVNLAAVAIDPTGTRPTASPCWRLMMYKDGGPGLDPNHPESKLRPELPDRSVYFTDFDPKYPQPTRYDQASRAHPDPRDPERYVNDGVAFFRDPNVTISNVRPGGFMVVGAGEDDGAGKYVSKLSSAEGTLAYTDQGIALQAPVGGLPQGVTMQDGTGNPIDDPDRFAVQAIQDGNGLQDVAVAIINRVDDDGVDTTPPILRNFTFTEPANGYPNRVEGSTWKPGGRRQGAGRYEPAVDIPLDDQRAEFDPKGFQTLPLGTGGKLQANRISELNDGETRLTLPGFRLGEGFNEGVRLGGGLNGKPDTFSRTIPGFKWVYLQRLANPMLPWNPEPFLPDGTTQTPGFNANLAVNPYLTVDSMGANVTVFTGVSEEERRVDRAEAASPILRYRNRTPIFSFSSVQRGRRNKMQQPADPDGMLELQKYIAGRTDAKVNSALNDAQDEFVQLNMWNPEPIGYVNGNVTGLWKNEAGPARNGVAPGGSNYNFRGIPDHTLGFLNEPFRAAGGVPRGPNSARGDQTKPKAPFSTLTWHNRPFANAGELLQVPAYDSTNLLGAYSMRDDTVAASNPTKEPYEGQVPANERRQLWEKSRWDDLLDLATDGPFGHLQNFFRNTNVDPNGVLNAAEDAQIAGMHRILDYVHVQSPYVSTETWLNPTSFGSAVVPNKEDPRYLLQPPFNNVSAQREPGRLNLNTIASGTVWDGGVLHRELFNPALPWDPLNNNYRLPDLTNNIPGHDGPLFVRPNPLNSSENGLMEGRRGYPPNVTITTPGASVLDDQMLLLHPQFPTFFANPFRSPSASDLVPLNNLMRPASESTLLRRNAFNTGWDGEWGIAGTDNNNDSLVDNLLEFGMGGGRRGPNDILDSEPSFASASNEIFKHSNRNSLFRYMPISRMSSMTSNRSNVYAVWVTIGFFEVEPAPDRDEFADANGFGGSATLESNAMYDLVYPEGYQFGKEAGIDTGDIRRVREFAMIDRTVPVAFEPGHNHNVDKAIRLRRRLE